MANPNPSPATRFKPGNKLWQLRDPEKGHRPPIYSDPEKLWEDCAGYFAWADANPLIEERVFCSKGGEIVRADIEKIRPYTIGGLCLFLNVSTRVWEMWRDREDLKAVVESVDTAIYEQKFAAAAVGLMDAGFIGKAIGLVDKKEVAGGISITVAPEDARL